MDNNIPWKYVSRFFILAFIQVAELAFFSENYFDSPVYLRGVGTILNYLLPFILVLIMFFSKRKLYKLRFLKRTIVMIAYSMSYTISLLIFILISHLGKPIFSLAAGELVVIVLSFIIIFVLSMLIVNTIIVFMD